MGCIRCRTRRFVAARKAEHGFYMAGAMSNFSSIGAVRPCMPSLRLPEGVEGPEPDRALADTGPVPEQSGGEAQRPRGRTDPGVPTPEEYKRRMLTRRSHRRWCRYCVMARMRNDAHLRLPPFSRSEPLLVADYCLIRSKEDQDLLALMVVDVPQPCHLRDPLQ